MENQHQNQTHSSRRILRSFKAKADARRTWSEKFSDSITSVTGNVLFLSINVVWFTVWMVVNLGFIPGIKPFDPFPFGLLTMIVSLEAIILSTFVLISQNREAKIADIREEVDVQIDVLAEQETAKALELLTMLLKKNGVDLSGDKVLKEMTKPTNTEKIEKALEKEIT